MERKIRESKRDIRKAAKKMKKSGMAPSRSKKTRTLAMLALKVSNAHADKEGILNHILHARENARVSKSQTRRERAAAAAGAEHEANGGATTGISEGGQKNISSASKCSLVPDNNMSKKQLLYIPVRDSNNFAVQFNRSLNELVFPTNEADGSKKVQLPCVSYLVTLDARCAVQCLPWTLLDTIVDAASAYPTKRNIGLFFVLTKVDLVSAPAIVSQVSLLSHALTSRYGMDKLKRNIIMAVAPVSVYHDSTCRHLRRMLSVFVESDNCKLTEATRTNMNGKVATFVIGLPNTGRHSLCRALASEENENVVSVVPLKAVQLQLMSPSCSASSAAATSTITTRKKESAGVGDATGKAAASTAVARGEAETACLKLAFPNAKAITLIHLPEDACLRKELQKVYGCEVFFRAATFVEGVPEPEAIGVSLFCGIADPVALAQAFCVPAVTQQDSSTVTHNKSAAVKAGRRFLLELGKAVRRDKGFYVSPLFTAGSGTMGRIASSSLTGHANFTSGQSRSQASLLDVTYSNATPSRFIRIATVVAGLAHNKRHRRPSSVRRGDAHNALRLGARTFIRELCTSRHVPWAVMRAAHGETVTEEQVANASLVWDVALCRGHRRGGEEAMASSSKAHLELLIQSLSLVLKHVLSLLPNGVVEMRPDSIVAPQYHVDDELKHNEEGSEVSHAECDDEEEAEEEEDDEGEDDEDEDEEGDEEEDEEKDDDDE